MFNFILIYYSGSENLSVNNYLNRFMLDSEHLNRAVNYRTIMDISLEAVLDDCREISTKYTKNSNQINYF